MRALPIWCSLTCFDIIQYMGLVEVQLPKLGSNRHLGQQPSTITGAVDKSPFTTHAYKLCYQPALHLTFYVAVEDGYHETLLDPRFVLHGRPNGPSF